MVKKLMVPLWCLIGMTLVGSTASASDQSYSQWKYEPQQQRHTCTYTFKPTPVSPPKHQTCVHYPNDPVRKDFIYFYNHEKKKYWGRCVAPSHPQYDPNQMKWSFIEPNNSWGPVTNTCPPIPGTTQGVGPEIDPPPPPPPADAPPPPSAM